ncbi:MAG: hypothetical protein PHF46_03235 [Candidatus Gracilibacteria bacterium]|nr:hypothetical protein [Candidatus Gracilibacteria bacterium]
MLAEIIPLDISIDNEGFIYSIPDEILPYLKIGSLVEIPLKYKSSYGIVAKLNVENVRNFEIRDILNVTCSTSLLSDYQIETIYSLSSKYFINIHKVLSLFLPKFVIKNLERKSFLDITEEKEKIIFKPNLKIDLDLKLQKRNTLVFNQTGLNNLDIIAKICTILEDGIFIFQDNFVIEDFLLKYPSFKKNSIILKDKFTYTKKYKTFLEIYFKSHNFVFGTRQLLKQNFSKYKNIVYLEDSFYKNIYSYTHKYNNLEILDAISKNGNFNKIIVSSVPSIELMCKVYNKKIGYLELRK